MLVSIIIACYNHDQYVAQAIESALNQAYPTKEVIVVDDGSTDRSAVVIASYGNAIEPIFSSHAGQCSACNAGFARSRGDIVIFLDSDDYFLPGAVESLAEPFKANRTVVRSQGYLTCIDTHGVPSGARIPRRLSPSGDYREATLQRGPGACRHPYTSGNAWARWFLERVMPLPEREELAVDACLVAVSSLLGLTASIDAPVAAYRIHDRNIGPYGETFDRQSLRRRMNRAHFTQDYLASWAGQLGYQVRLDAWRARGDSWRYRVLEYSLSSMEGSPQRIAFKEFVLSPFSTSHNRRPKALLISALLALLWILPRKPALALSRLLLRLPRAPSAAHESIGEQRKQKRTVRSTQR